MFQNILQNNPIFKCFLLKNFELKVLGKSFPVNLSTNLHFSLILFTMFKRLLLTKGVFFKKFDFNFQFFNFL